MTLHTPYKCPCKVCTFEDCYDNSSVVKDWLMIHHIIIIHISMNQTVVSM